MTVLRSFDERSYWQFETALPQVLLSVGKPYDLDFPIISVPLSETDASRSVEEWHALLQRVFPNVCNLTTPSQRLAGVASFTLLEPLDISLEDLVRSYSALPGSAQVVKIRLYISQRARVIRVVPICIPIVEEEAIRSNGSLRDPALDDLFTSLVARVRDADPFPLEPRYNCLVYLASFEYGRLFLGQLRRLAEDAGPWRPAISEADVRLLFGHDMAPSLAHKLRERLNGECPKVGIHRRKLGDPPLAEPLDSSLAEYVLTELVAGGYEGAPVTNLVREALKIVDRQVEADDPSNPPRKDYARLRTGLSLCDLWWIARKLCAIPEKPSFAAMSFLLDYYIDLGVIVPVVTKVRSLYCRVYRRGEADPVEYAQLVHQLLIEHEEAHPNSSLDTTFFTKIMAAQAIYHPGLVPLEPVFDLYGAVPYVALPEAVERQTMRALEFLRDKGVIHLVTPDDAKDDQQLPLF